MRGVQYDKNRTCEYVDPAHERISESMELCGTFRFHFVAILRVRDSLWQVLGMLIRS